MIDVAIHFAKNGRYERAADILEEALIGMNKRLGESHSDSIRTAELLSMMYFKLGCYAKGIELCEKTISTLNHDDTHPLVLKLMTLVAINKPKHEDQIKNKIN